MIKSYRTVDKEDRDKIISYLKGKSLLHLGEITHVVGFRSHGVIYHVIDATVFFPSPASAKGPTWIDILALNDEKISLAKSKLEERLGRELSLT